MDTETVPFILSKEQSSYNWAILLGERFLDVGIEAFQKAVTKNMPLYFYGRCPLQNGVYPRIGNSVFGTGLVLKHRLSWVLRTLFLYENQDWEWTYGKAGFTTFFVKLKRENYGYTTL